MTKLQKFWIDLPSSLWFVPSLIILGAIILAVAMVEVDSRISWKLVQWAPRLFGASAEGSRGILTTVAGSMIRVAGVTFSITIVARSLASNQFTPRILRNFMRDRNNQVVLGVFVGGRLSLGAARHLTERFSAHLDSRRRNSVGRHAVEPVIGKRFA